MAFIWYNTYRRSDKMAAIFPSINNELMLYATVMLTVGKSRGTGFFYNLEYDNDIRIPVIVTNKHVLNNETKPLVVFRVHTGSFSSKSIDNESIEIKLNVEWVYHPTQDLCVTPLKPILDAIKERNGKEIFYTAIDKTISYPRDRFTEFSAVEDVLMVGYPIGLWDANNNYPLFRRGITASHPAVDFKDENKEITVDSIGVVDMACFPGSSGSPIFVYYPASHVDKAKNSVVLGSQLVFLGVLFSGPRMRADGTITIQNIPTGQVAFTTTPVMINLGYYIKSYELEFFKSHFAKFAIPPLPDQI